QQPNPQYTMGCFHSLWVLLPVLAVYFALTIRSALLNDLWRDEAWTVMATDPPPGVSYWHYYRQRIMPIDNNPPLYYAMMRGARLVVGERPILWRFAGILAGAASILLLYRLGRQWRVREAGLLA